jgi:hypothetical protein
VRDGLIGWQSNNMDPACQHDSFDDGLKPGVLELRWSVVVPENGSYEVVPAGYGLGGWGDVQSRGAAIGDYFAKARFEVEARAPSCTGSWSFDVATARVTGPWTRVAAFSGWVNPPNIVLRGCSGGETLEVGVRLVGESNRGRISVDWFGFSAMVDEDVNRIFALRPRASEPSLPVGLPQTLPSDSNK